MFYIVTLIINYASLKQQPSGAHVLSIMEGQSISAEMVNDSREDVSLIRASLPEHHVSSLIVFDEVLL